MSNHPNRDRLPYKMYGEGSKVAAFADYAEAMLYAQQRSVGRGLTQVTSRGGYCGEYVTGHPTPATAKAHEALMEMKKQ